MAFPVLDRFLCYGAILSTSSPNVGSNISPITSQQMAFAKILGKELLPLRLKGEER